MSEKLPEFDSPPVIETVLGMQFDQLPRFSNAYLGAFWQTLGSEWPDASDAPSLPQEFERFAPDRLPSRIGMGLGFKVSASPQPIRVQVRNNDMNRMIQLQNGRFHYNWLGRDGSSYTRYETVRREFLEMLELFRDFSATNELGTIKPNQWEITYVNHIPRGTVWHSSADWNRVFSALVELPADLPGGSLESFSSQLHFALADERGRLHVELEHGFRQRNEDNEQEVLILKLTARGSVSTSNPNWTVESGLDIGHEAIVRSFDKLVSTEAKSFWRVRS